MDKRFGTDLHLWRFFTRAKQKIKREFNCTCLAPHPILDQLFIIWHASIVQNSHYNL